MAYGISPDTLYRTGTELTGLVAKERDVAEDARQFDKKISEESRQFNLQNQRMERQAKLEYQYKNLANQRQIASEQNRLIKQAQDQEMKKQKMLQDEAYRQAKLDKDLEQAQKKESLLQQKEETKNKMYNKYNTLADLRSKYKEAKAPFPSALSREMKELEVDTLKSKESSKYENLKKLTYNSDTNEAINLLKSKKGSPNYNDIKDRVYEKFIETYGLDAAEKLKRSIEKEDLLDEIETMNNQ